MDARDYSVDMSHPSLKGLISKGAPLIIATKEEVEQMMPSYKDVSRDVNYSNSLKKPKRPCFDTALQIYWTYHYSSKEEGIHSTAILFNTTKYWVQRICRNAAFYEVRLGKSVEEANRLNEIVKKTKLKKLKNENKRLTTK